MYCFYAGNHHSSTNKAVGNLQHVQTVCQPQYQVQSSSAKQSSSVSTGPLQQRHSSSSLLDADSSSTKSGRRPSVDTVSTYLSHDSEHKASKVNIIYSK